MLSLFYKVPSADEAMLLRGWRVDGTRQVTGGAFVLPPLRRVHVIPLVPEDVEVEFPFDDPTSHRHRSAFDGQGIELLIHAAISFRVDDVMNVGRRFATDPVERMRTRVKRIFEDVIPDVTGTMAAEEIAVKDRRSFTDAVLDGAEREMTQVGLAAEGLTVGVRDKEGYINQLGDQKQSAMAGAANYARVATDLQNWRNLGALYAGAAQLPDGRSIEQAVEDSLERYAPLAQSNHGES